MSLDKVKKYHEPDGSGARQDNALPMTQNRTEDQTRIAHDFNEPFAEFFDAIIASDTLITNIIRHVMTEKTSSTKSEACDTSIRVDHSFPNPIGQQETTKNSTPA